MKDFIAVISAKLLLKSQPVKRTALLFDRIAAPEINLGLPALRKAESFLGIEYVNDLEWLHQTGILFEPELKVTEVISQDEQFLSDYISAKKSNEEFKNALSSTKNSHSDEFIDYAASYALKHGMLVSRYTAALMRKQQNCDAYPLISTPFSDLSVVEGGSEVIQVVLKNIPIPDEKTSWEQIMEYRSDPDSKEKFYRLRHWMSEISKQQLNANEIEEKLEWLLHDYERHLKLHQLKIYPGLLETFITTGAELAENLIKLNWGKAAKTMFSLRHRKLALMEAEMNSPGAEIAYAYKTRKTFG
jgi:hypothetical protein